MEKNQEDTSSSIVEKVRNEIEDEELINTVDNQLPINRPTTLGITTGNTTTETIYRRYNIDDIRLTPSPLDTTRSFQFQAGSIIDPVTFARIEASVSNKLKAIIKEEEKQDQEKEQTTLDDILIQARQEELERLSQYMNENQPTSANEIIDILLALINNVPELTTPSTMSNTINIEETSDIATMDRHSYPPSNQTGPVIDHDRPYADYGHLDRATIAQEFQFNLQPTTTTNKPSIRLNAKSFAITSWTNISKDLVMNKIKQEFGIENIRYICIGEEISELNQQRHLHIQIIFKDKVNRRKPFLDEITETHCNYQVTNNDRAWNEYIRKGGDYIEFGEYQSTSARSHKQWPSSTSLSSSSVSVVIAGAAARPLSTTASGGGGGGDDEDNQLLIPRTTRATTVREQAEEKRQQKRTIIIQAYEIAANTSVDAAMVFMRDKLPWEFATYNQWFKNAFIFTRLQTEQEMDRRGITIPKEYTWPESFPDCTPVLREVVDRWLRHHFNRKSRAKCLILIGPTGTGKTSFAKSLPGRYNYFAGRWRLNSWNDFARYSIFDDIDWDKFDDLGFPNKKHLLTQNGPTNATDKYQRTKEINVRQPAILLLNPGRPEGLLAREPRTYFDKKEFEFWSQRAIIYRMGPDEYFYKKISHRINDDGDDNNDPDNPMSSNSTILSDHQDMNDAD